MAEKRKLHPGKCSRSESIDPDAWRDADAVLGIPSGRSLGVVKRYRCGCTLMRDGTGRRAREYVQCSLMCPGGDEHGRPVDDGAAETGKLF